MKDGKRTGHERNPFSNAGPVDAKEMIARDQEAAELSAHVEGGHSFRVLAPRRYGTTSLLRRVLDEAEGFGMATALVDLRDVLTIGEIAVRIERAYSARFGGEVRLKVDALLKSWDVGLSLGRRGYAETLQRNPRTAAHAVLARLLQVPAELQRRGGPRSFVVFDQIQDVLAVPDADAAIRSVIQFQSQLGAASYAFAGSAPRPMQQLFDHPKRPPLEHALATELGPLPVEELRDSIAKRFKRTGRDPGDALDPLIAFTRGHPQRSMLLAHHLWASVRPDTPADETVWLRALERAYADSAEVMEATWRSLPVGERRVALALAVADGPLYGARTAAAVGIKRTTIRKALDGLRGRGEVINEDGGEPRLTDPLVELWLQRRGLAADAPGD
jgi:uncharacterized protein